MMESKSWYSSKTVWGGLIALVSGLLGIAGITISPEEQELIIMSVTAIASSIGGLLAVYGRIKTDRKRIK